MQPLKKLTERPEILSNRIPIRKNPGTFGLILSKVEFFVFSIRSIRSIRYSFRFDRYCVRASWWTALLRACIHTLGHFQFSESKRRHDIDDMTSSFGRLFFPQTHTFS